MVSQALWPSWYYDYIHIIINCLLQEIKIDSLLISTQMYIISLIVLLPYFLILLNEAVSFDRSWSMVNPQNKKLILNELFILRVNP